jgi:hypothetical protein
MNKIINYDININEMINSKMIEYVEYEFGKMLEDNDYSIEAIYMNRLKYLLKNAGRKLYIKNRTIIYGLALMKRFLKSENEKKKKKNNLDLLFIFTSCLILGYKMENIVHLNNSFFCSVEIGGLDNETINVYEKFIIKELNFNLYVNEKEFEKIIDDISAFSNRK